MSEPVCVLLFEVEERRLAEIPPALFPSGGRRMPPRPEDQALVFRSCFYHGEVVELRPQQTAAIEPTRLMKNRHYNSIHFTQIAGGLPIVRIGTFGTPSPPEFIDMAKDLQVLFGDRQFIDRLLERRRRETLYSCHRRAVLRLLAANKIEPPHDTHEFQNALFVREIVLRRATRDHGCQMRRTFDSGLPLDQRVIGHPDRSDLARTPGLARKPFDGVEAVWAFAQERFESPLGAKASPHVLNGVNIASRSPKLCLLAKNRFIVRRSLQHHGQAVRRATRKVKIGSQLRSVAHCDEHFLRFSHSVHRLRKRIRALQNQGDAGAPLFPGSADRRQFRVDFAFEDASDWLYLKLKLRADARDCRDRNSEHGLVRTVMLGCHSIIISDDVKYEPAYIWSSYPISINITGLRSFLLRFLVNCYPGKFQRDRHAGLSKYATDSRMVGIYLSLVGCAGHF